MATPRGTFLAELRDAVDERTALLVVGVLLIQLGFILSYVGAFHHPTPHRVPVEVVAPAQVAPQAVAGLNGIKGAPLRATVSAGEAAATAELRTGGTDGVLVVEPSGSTDRLLVASGGGAAVSTAVETVVSAAEAAQHRTVTVTDVVPAQPGDARGLTGFYLVIGWLVGGYLVSSLLGVAKGARPATTRRAAIRLLALIPYAVLSGLGGALVVGPWLGALHGHLLAVWALGALLVWCAAAVTTALQVLAGVLGVGLTVILFVVLGNPSAGGAYPAPLLPSFWRAISGAIPNGAGVSAVRRIVYFGGHGIGGEVAVIALWAVLGAVVALGGAALRERRGAGAAAESPAPVAQMS